jgi:hypothetical protein
MDAFKSALAHCVSENFNRHFLFNSAGLFEKEPRLRRRNLKENLCIYERTSPINRDNGMHVSSYWSMQPLYLNFAYY